uniref:Phosphate transporter n=1 Tax=Lotharella globosa TaxID=91324 RepID=A0A7S3YL53_9EUKA
MSDSVEDYEWIVVMCGIFAFVAACGIGANDVANAFATSVGSKALTLRQAVIIAAFFEMAGAVLMGSHVAKTIRKGIADHKCFSDNPPLLMHGMMCVVAAVGIWLFTASRFELPVSTTHSTIGGIIFMTLTATGDPSCVIWYKETDTFPFMGGVSAVVLSWVLSPVFSAIVAGALFFLIRSCVLRSEHAFMRSIYTYPLLVGFTLTLNTFYIIYKGSKSIDLDEIELGVAIGAAFAVGGGAAIILIPFLARLKTYVEGLDFSADVSEKGEASVGKKFETDSQVRLDKVGSTASLDRVGSLDKASIAGNTQGSIEVKKIETGDLKQAQHKAGTPTITREYSSSEYSMRSGKPKPTKTFAQRLGNGVNKDLHEITEIDDRTKSIHDNAEVFDPRAEEVFKYLQVFTAMCDAFAHGANDVANAMGPFAACYMIWREGEVSKKAELGADAYWILAIGGLGIVVGLATYGYHIVRAIGIKLAKITPSRGTCIELGSAAVVITGSRLELPLSTTHCQVGATMGVAALEGSAGINWWIFGKTVVGWVITLAVVGAMASVFMAQAIYAPCA